MTENQTFEEVKTIEELNQEMTPEDKKQRKALVVASALALTTIGVGTVMTVNHLNEETKQKENAERESIAESERVAESMSKAKEEAEVQRAIRQAEQDKAFEQAQAALAREHAEYNAKKQEQNTQTPVQNQTTNVAQADEQPRPAQTTQPARQQTQTPVQTTQTPAPVETRNVGVNLAGRAVEIPKWIHEQLVAEGLGVRYPDGTYGPARGKLMAYDKRLIQLQKEAGNLP